MRMRCTLSFLSFLLPASAFHLQQQLLMAVFVPNVSAVCCAALHGTAPMCWAWPWPLPSCTQNAGAASTRLQTAGGIHSVLSCTNWKQCCIISGVSDWHHRCSAGPALTASNAQPDFRSCSSQLQRHCVYDSATGEFIDFGAENTHMGKGGGGGSCVG